MHIKSLSQVLSRDPKKKQKKQQLQIQDKWNYKDKDKWNFICLLHIVCRNIVRILQKKVYLATKS